MDFEMEKVYNPQAIEDKLYQMWEESGAFVAHRVEGKKPFTIVMPPPNITGQLHMGHAMDCLLQDAPIRYHRMKGDPTLWLPGTDHASIATEVKVVEQMAKEGLTKEMLGREGFLERAWAWKKGIWRPHQPPAAPPGRQLRLEPRALHHGRGLQPRRARGVCQALRKGASSTAATASSTGARSARPRFPMPRWSMRSKPAICGTSAIPARTAARAWWWPPRAPKPCWAIPAWRSTPMTRAIRTWWAKR